MVFCRYCTCRCRSVSVSLDCISERGIYGLLIYVHCSSFKLMLMLDEEVVSVAILIIESCIKWFFPQLSYRLFQMTCAVCVSYAPCVHLVVFLVDSSH
jgi:hypothetical protein